MHRIIPYKTWLYEDNVIKYLSSKMRKEGKVDDMTYHLIECIGLNNFWNVFENWWNIEPQHIKFN